MRDRNKRENSDEDLVTAIGLIWGHLGARQFEEALLLARGSMRIWPDDRTLQLMSAYAAVEVLEPFREEQMKAVASAGADCADCVNRILRRAANAEAALAAEK